MITIARSRAWPATAVRALAVALLAASTSGCLTAAAYHVAQEGRRFDRLRHPAPNEFAWAQAPGVTVSGSLHLATDQTTPFPGGVRSGPREILTCEGLPIRLIPDTEHMRFMLDREFGLKVSGGGYWKNGSYKWPWPAESAAAVRETTCGADGAFRFENVPDGPWLVMARIHPPAYAATGTDSDVVLKAVRIESRGRPVQLDVRIGDNFLYGVTRQG